MRRLLLVVPLLFAAHAFAQTQAANPVEPFSYGVRVGTAKNPLIAALSSVVPSAQAGSTQAAMPVEMFSYGRRVGTQSNPIYVNLGNALDGYLPLTGGNTTGALNGYQFASLTGSSASGATTTLSTDGSNAISEDTCLVVPLKGVTEFDINAAGVSSNGTDAVMNRFSGTAAYRSDGVLQLNNSTASNNYPGFGSPGTWSIALSSDSSSGCLVVKATAGGTGSWSWRANIHYENLVP
ncbi:hypothetical protein [Gluconobacter cerinus]|uniref:hypothetical protein n=1 Tax=Gluconobacter cerinus TaxID=38307 RepID=UPI001B8CB72C|nr:hypothetical protein [Gluconobacter cerinus]MBS1037226.1 hypothetical protein [Gluconobacter cerinus]